MKCHAIPDRIIYLYFCEGSPTIEWLWEQTPQGYIIFDDTVVDERHAKKIGLAKKTVFWQCPGDDKWHRYRHVCLRQSGVRPVLVDRLSDIRP